MRTEQREPNAEQATATYRNPVYVACRWQAMLDNGQYECAADPARGMGVSRARVTQVLSF